MMTAADGARRRANCRRSRSTAYRWSIRDLNVYRLNVFRATRPVAPIMVAQMYGAIVNISSAWARTERGV